MPAFTAAIEVGARGHRARERSRRQHRNVCSQWIRHQLEQGHRSVSTLNTRLFFCKYIDKDNNILV